MSELPARLSPGQRLTAHWLNRLLDYLRARELRPGPGIKLTRTPSGTTIGAATARESGPPVSVECCPAVVETVYAAIPGAYRVRLYPEGLGGHAGASALLCATERGVEPGLVSGTVVLAHAVALAAAEDGEDPE